MVHAIDIDPELIEKHAKASVRAGSEGWRHMEAEFIADIPNLMTTLSPQEPYAYTIMPQVMPDGSVKSPILTTREQIEEAYKLVRGRSWLYGSEALIEIRSPWYQFTEAVSLAQTKNQSQINANHLISLFPLGSGRGITGELVWVKIPREQMGLDPAPIGAPTDDLTRRREILDLHESYVAALLANDADAVVEHFANGAQGAIRDYVAETGSLAPLEGIDANRDYYARFFDKFEIGSVELLQRAAQEWYIFAELRITATVRATGQTIGFNTAEFFVPARDGRFILRVGHGTDPVQSNGVA